MAESQRERKTETAVVAYARAVYDAMLADADKDGLWEGKVSELVGKVASRNRYADIMAILKEVGAVEQVRRGAGAWGSIYKVTPGIEISSRTVVPRRPTAKDMGALRQEVADLRESLGGLNVVKVLADQQAEIEYLKRRVAEIGNPVGGGASGGVDVRGAGAPVGEAAS